MLSLLVAYKRLFIIVLHNIRNSKEINFNKSDRKNKKKNKKQIFTV